MIAVAERKRDIAGLKTLNVGCGPHSSAEAVGIDWDPGSAADVVHDLNKFPWPFPEGRFEKVTLHHVLEHLADPDRAVREAHRLCSRGGILEVVTPHYSSYESYGDITHRYHFGLVTFKPYYDSDPSMHRSPESTGDRSKPLFKLVSRRLGWGSSPLCWPGRLIAALSFDLYEKYFAFWFPARNMSFVLEALK